MEKPMEATDKLFAGSIPELYDRLLVPMIFAPYAADLAARVAKREPRHLLEIACGTGAVTRALAARLPATTRIFATDLNPPMLARAKLRHGDESRIAWQQADALNLPFDDGQFDTVVCQFGAMFFPDKVKGYKEAHRVLTPKGHFFFSVWDRISENEFAEVMEKALAGFFPADPPTFMARTPHGYYDLDRIRGELDAAGFAEVSITPVDAISKAASAQDVAVALCQGTPLRNEIDARDAARLEEATQCVAEALTRRFGTGAIEGRIRAFVVTAAR